MTSSEDCWARLSPDALCYCAACMRITDLLALTACNRSLREVLCGTHPSAASLWKALACRDAGERVTRIVQASSNAPQHGPALYRASRQYRLSLQQMITIKMGSVADRGNLMGVQVVACPVRSDLIDLGIGAQAAIRHAAGEALQQSLISLDAPQPTAAVTLHPGGDLCACVAACVTSVPLEARHSDQAAYVFLLRLHQSLLSAVRNHPSNYRTLALPILCAGGMGMDAELVCDALASAAVLDIAAGLEHGALRLSVCCFEEEHATYMERSWRAAFAAWMRGDEASCVAKPPGSPRPDDLLTPTPWLSVGPDLPQSVGASSSLAVTAASDEHDDELHRRLEMCNVLE